MSDLTAVIPWDGKDEPLLRQALQSLPRGTRFVVAQNDGPLEMAAALNEALTGVTTEWALIMGADDLASPTMVDDLMAGCGSADGAYPGMQCFGGATHRVVAEPFSPHRQLDQNGVPGVLLIRTAALRAVGGWRPVPLEDWDLAVRLSQAGFYLVPVEKATYHYRRRASGLNSLTAQCIIDGDFTYEELRDAICGERQSWPACFYVSATPGISYVRGELMGLHMPAPVRLTYYPEADYAVSVWHHATKDSQAGITEDRKRGRSIVVDVDDNYLDPHLIHVLRHQARWSPGLKATADQWQKLLPSHRKVVAAADAVVVSTPALAESYARVNGNVRVVRNAVEPLHWRPFLSGAPLALPDDESPMAPGKGPRCLEEPPTGGSSHLRVGWAAASQHGPDAELAEPAMRWASQQDDVEVVVVGLDPGWDFAYTHVPTTLSVHAYRDVLQTLDVGIAPLKPGGINHWKSDLKWLEYTCAGAATVASDLEPYATIRDGVTGLKARDKHELRAHVQTLVEDDDVRAGLVRQAREYVLAERTAERAGAEYLEAIQAREAIAA